MKLDRNLIEWKDDFLVYNGVLIQLTNQELIDFNLETGKNPEELVLKLYQNCLESKSIRQLKFTKENQSST